MKIKLEKDIILESHAIIQTPFDFHACEKCQLNTNHNINRKCLLCEEKKKWVSLEDLKKALDSLDMNLEDLIIRR